MGSPDWLRRVFAAAARIDPERVDPDLPLSASGLDSLAAVELKQAVEEAAGVSLSLADLLEGMTLRDLERRRLPGTAGVPAGPRPFGAGRPAGRRRSGRASRSPGTSARSGSSTAWRRRAPPTTSPARRGSGPCLPRPWAARSRGWWTATPCCAPRSPIRPPGPCSGWRRGLERPSRSWTRPAGATPRCMLGCIRRRSVRSTSRPGRSCGRSCCGAAEESFLVLAVHHVAADFWSMAVLARELRRAGGGGGPAPAGGPVHRLRPPAGADAGGPRGRAAVGALAGAPGRRCRSSTCPPTGRGVRCRPCAAARGRFRPRRSGRRRSTGSPPPTAARRSWPCSPPGRRCSPAGAARRTSSPAPPWPAAPPASGRRWWATSSTWCPCAPTSPAIRRSRELMARTRRTVLDALAHQDLPFALLTERLQPERDPGRPPLVAAMLTLREGPGAGAGRARGLRRGRAGRPAGPGRAGPGVAPPGAARRAARPLADRGRAAGRARRLPAVGRRPVRRRDHRADARPPRPPARRDGRRAGSSGSRSCRC